MVVGWRNSTVGSISTITYNGAGLTLVTGQTRGSARVEIWGLVAPDTGPNNVVITHSAGFDNGCTALAISHTGVDQTTPWGTPATATSTTGNPTVNVSSASGELVIDIEIGVASGTVHTVGAGQTQELNQQAGNASAKVGSSTEAGAATVTMSWSYNISPGWAIAAVPLKPDTGGGGGTTIEARLQASGRGMANGMSRGMR